MKLTGTIKQILDPITGVSKSGNNYAKQGFIIEVKEDGLMYPMSVYCEAFGDEKMAVLQSKTIGQEVSIYVSINSREWNGRWFTDISLNKFIDDAQKPQQSAGVVTQRQPQPQPQMPQPQPQPQQPQYDDGLPF